MKTIAKILVLLVMICPLCKKYKEKSKVYYKFSTSSYENCTGYWNEEGVFQQPKCEEKAVHQYRCSEGHIFSKTSDELAAQSEAEEKKLKEKK